MTARPEDGLLFNHPEIHRLAKPAPPDEKHLWGVNTLHRAANLRRSCTIDHRARS